MDQATCYIRSVKIHNKPLNIGTKAWLGRARDGHLGVSGRAVGEACLSRSDGQRIQARSPLILPLEEQCRLLILDLEGFLRSSKAEIRRPVVGRKDKVNLMLSSLIVHGAVTMKGQAQ